MQRERYAVTRIVRGCRPIMTGNCGCRSGCRSLQLDWSSRMYRAAVRAERVGESWRKGSNRGRPSPCVLRTKRPGPGHVGFIDERTRAFFQRGYAAEQDFPLITVEQSKSDEAIAEADALLLTLPNQLGVMYNSLVIEASKPSSRARYSPRADAGRCWCSRPLRFRPW